MGIVADGVRRQAAAPRQRRIPAWRIAERSGLLLLILCAALLEVNVVSGPDAVAAPAMVAALDAQQGTPAEMIMPGERIADAVVAVEDSSFYRDGGVSLPALARGLWGYVRGTDSGGSTIEIQLAHVLFPAATAGLWGRVHRVTLAIAFDGHFTKDAILSMYLDSVYFGHGFTGIAAASRGYFDCTPAQLSWQQAAMLAGLIASPSALDPLQHLAAAMQRMRYVLQRLVVTGMLSQTDAQRAATAPLHL